MDDDLRHKPLFLNGSGGADSAVDFFGRIIDGLPDPFFVKDEDHRWVAINRAFCELMGRPYEELIGKTDSDFLSKQESEVFYAKDDEVFATGATIENEESITNARGERLHLCTRKSILSDGTGKRFLIGLIRDVTARRRIEEDLRLSEQRFIGAFESAPIGMALVSTEGRFIKVNHALAQILGYSADALMELTFQELTHPDDLARNLEYVRQMLARTISAYRMEKRYIHRDGRTVWALLSVSLVLEGDGRPLHFIAQIQDITEQKATIGALEEQRGKAEKASRAKSEFLANMSHEIRTPLNAVLGMTELLLDTSVSESERREYLETIYTSGKSLLGILNDILDFSKIEARKLQLREGPFSLSTLLKEIGSLFSLSAQQRDIRLSVLKSPEVPDELIGDSHRLRQVLVNLVGNALKFTDADGNVELSASRVEGLGGATRLAFTVTDSGVGIAVEKLPELFQQFHQLDNSATRQHGGTGLGLAISSRLVELMGGELAVESRVGQGSIFSFSLPLRVAPGIGSDRIASAALVQPIAPARILVAEDNRFNQLLLRSILEKSGHSVVVASNGAEALERATESDFDIVLLDVQMPVMDGYEAIRRLRAEEARSGKRRIPVVAITAHAVDGHKDRCLDAGMNDFITKPIDRKALLKKISRLVAESRWDRLNEP